MSRSKIHLLTDRFFIMPISGRHVYSECGRTFQWNYDKDRSKVTEYATLVTCKQCLKKIKDFSEE